MCIGARHGKACGLNLEVIGLQTLSLAATFRAASASSALPLLVKEHIKARGSRYSNISPFLRSWTGAGAVGHMHSTFSHLSASCSLPIPHGQGLQA